MSEGSASEVKLQGLEECVKNLLKVPEMLRKKVLGQVARAAALRLAAGCRRRIHDVTGALSKAVTVAAAAGSDGVTVTYLVVIRKGDTTRRIAHLVEFGTDPHVIFPHLSTRLKKRMLGALRLGNGKLVPVVRHPGAAPKPFMRPALEEGYQEAIDAAVAQFQKRMDELGEKGLLS